MAYQGMHNFALRHSFPATAPPLSSSAARNFGGLLRLKDNIQYLQAILSFADIEQSGSLSQRVELNIMTAANGNSSSLLNSNKQLQFFLLCHASTALL
jgi:hypothetical protein